MNDISQLHPAVILCVGVGSVALILFAVVATLVVGLLLTALGLQFTDKIKKIIKTRTAKVITNCPECGRWMKMKPPPVIDYKVMDKMHGVSGLLLFLNNPARVTIPYALRGIFQRLMIEAHGEMGDHTVITEENEES